MGRQFAQHGRKEPKAAFQITSPQIYK